MSERSYHRAHLSICLDTSVDEQHPVLSAFLQAYNFHEDLILSPDDVWLMILISFASYVNENRTNLADLYFEDNETARVLTIENEETSSAKSDEFSFRFSLTNFFFSLSVGKIFLIEFISK